VRSLKVTSALNDSLQQGRPGVAQVAQLTRVVIINKTGKTTTEVVYLITTLSATQASPLRLLALVRRHWGIENRSHYVRDVTFQEDRSRLRTGHAPQIMATFRNLVITLIHRHGSSQILAARRSLGSHPDRALAWLLTPQAARATLSHQKGGGLFPLDTRSHSFPCKRLDRSF
jgi:predicted transposase YbfD/YdcC